MGVNFLFIRKGLIPKGSVQRFLCESEVAKAKNIRCGQIRFVKLSQHQGS